MNRTMTSYYYGWDVPCIALNTNQGVLASELASWDKVKSLYR